MERDQLKKTFGAYTRALHCLVFSTPFHCQPLLDDENNNIIILFVSPRGTDLPNFETIPRHCVSQSSVSPSAPDRFVGAWDIPEMYHLICDH